MIAVAMLFFLLASAVTIAIRVQPVFAATTLGFSPTPVVKQAPVPDSFFDVYLEVGDAAGLFGFDIKITWDNNLITYKSEVHEEYLNAMWGPLGSGFDWELVTAEGGAGYFRYVALSLGTEPGGNFALIKLSFDIVDPLTNSMKETSLHFDIHSLSNKQYQPITHTATDGTVQIWGKTPTLSLIPTSAECQMRGQEFDVEVSVSDALSVTSLTFDIRYTADMLDVVSVTWGVWLSGTEDHSVDGQVTGNTNGLAQDGTQTLLTIRFKEAFNPDYEHIWKDRNTIPGQNIWTGTVHIESATLDYPISQPNVTPTLGADVTCTWNPIQGDVDLDGDVDILDVRTVSAFYDQTNAKWNLTGADGKVDIFDLVVIANNFGFDLTP
jgi:hypothetical protein